MLSDATIDTIREALDYALQTQEQLWSAWAADKMRPSELAQALKAALVELDSLAAMQGGAWEPVYGTELIVSERNVTVNQRQHKPDITTLFLKRGDDELLMAILPPDLRLCRRTPAQPMDAPDGAGYYAFEGRIIGSSVENVQWLVMVRQSTLEKVLYAWRFGGMSIKASQMTGKWYKLQTPWDARPQEGEQDAN